MKNVLSDFVCANFRGVRLLVALLVLGCVSSASAVSYTWDTLDDATPTPTPTSALVPTSGTIFTWKNDYVSADLAGGVSALSGGPAANGSLGYTVDGLTVTVEAYYDDGGTTQGATVVHDSGKAGLGVYHKNGDTSDDNVTGTSSSFEVLTLTFPVPVSLSGLIFRNSGHNLLNSGNYLFNGVSQDFGSSPTSAIGTTFSFQYGGSSPDQFYLSGLTATAVPDGGLTAVLLGMSFLGLGTLSRRLRN